MKIKEFINVNEILSEYTSVVLSDDYIFTCALASSVSVIRTLYEKLIQHKEIHITYADWRYLEESDNSEYILYVTPCGDLYVRPIDDYDILYDVDCIYIDMDGAIEQDIIDECLDIGTDVTLFGERDVTLYEECDKNTLFKNFEKDNKCNSKEDFHLDEDENGYYMSFTKVFNNNPVTISIFSEQTLPKTLGEKIYSILCMNDERD